MVERFLAEHGITYPVAMASSSVVQRFEGVRLLPASFLIDRSGRIRNEVSGIFATGRLEQAVGRLLDEPAPGAATMTGGGVRTTTRTPFHWESLFGFNWYLAGARRLVRLLRPIELVSGALLVVFGVLMVRGRFAPLSNFFAGFGQLINPEL